MAQEHTTTENHGEHEATSTGLNHRKMLMWAFLGSDCMFFGSLIATYLVYQGKSLSGPLPIDVFDIPVTSVSTFVLLMSSMSMVLAYSALNRGNMKAFRIWMVSTAIMGSTFIGFQVYEFSSFSTNHIHFECSEIAEKIHDGENIKAGQDYFYQKECLDQNGLLKADHHVDEEYGLKPQTNLFGTTFFTLTGFHGAHVTLGVIWLLSIFFLSFKKGVITREKNLDVDLAALYWHFVDVVWIVIFTVVYLFGVFEGF